MKDSRSKAQSELDALEALNPLDVARMAVMYREALGSISRWYVAPYDMSGAAQDIRQLREIADSALVEADRMVKGNSK